MAQPPGFFLVLTKYDSSLVASIFQVISASLPWPSLVSRSLVGILAGRVYLAQGTAMRQCEGLQEAKIGKLRKLPVAGEESKDREVLEPALRPGSLLRPASRSRETVAHCRF